MFFTNTKLAFKALNQALKNNHKVLEVVDNWSATFLSDIHWGCGNDADDANDEAILHCLQDCQAKDIKSIILNGDIFEGWEADWQEVVRFCKTNQTRQAIFAILLDYHSNGNLYYIEGNHRPDELQQLLTALGFENIKPLDSLLIEFYGNAGKQLRSKFFALHGHQADGLNYYYPAIPKFFVKWLWTPIQNLTGLKWGWSTPATSKTKQNKIDKIMLRWCNSNNLHTIIGHTHQPQLHSKYYNIGCGVFGNESITAIDLHYQDKIKLNLNQIAKNGYIKTLNSKII
tara:strand:+ start:9925 stop:10782 length:858 start_codon:yes stop_codon:yes gene_type:complete